MRVLLLYPQFPKSFWSFDKTIELIGCKVSVPPLGMITVAGILPQDWEFRFIDRNIGPETEADWEWAEVVIVSGMIVQKSDLLNLIREAKQRNKPIAVEGPYVTSVPQEAQAAGVDFLILDEGEITLPLFVEALERGETNGIFRSDGSMCALLEHHIDYRQIVQNEIEWQITDYRAANLKEKSQQVEINESLVA